MVTVAESDKTLLADKTTHAVVYMYSLQCVFVSQYSTKVDFISMGKAQMWAKGGAGQSQIGTQGPLPPLEAATVDE